MITTKYGVRTAFAAAALAGFSIFNTASAANPATNTTSGGQSLNVTITAPLGNPTVSAGPVSVTGTTTIGPLTVNAAVLYVIDISGSTNSPTGGDCNGDGTVNSGDDLNHAGGVGETLDCEIASVQALNKSLANTAGVSAGAISFSDAAKQLDVDPVTSGMQAFVPAGADADHNGTLDVNQPLPALRSNGATNYDAALRVVNSDFAARPTNEQHVAFFLSDGMPTSGDFTTGSGSPLALAVSAHTVINTYSVGLGGAGCGSGSALLAIATATGGTCKAVTNPANLLAALANSTPAGISGVTLSVDSGTPVAVTTLDSLGNFTGTVTIPVASGPHTISATTAATDSFHTTATASVGVNVPLPVDTTPNPFGFNSTTAPEGGLLVNSVPATVLGIDGTVTVPISVTGGSYSINGGPFTSNPGSVKLNDVIVAQVTSSATPHGAATAHVTIGSGAGVGSSPDFTVITDSANLGLTKHVSASNVFLNDQITYTITVTNSGPDSATNVTVNDTLPAALTYVSASYVNATPSSNGPCAYDANTVTITCSIPSIANSGAATITVVAVANSVGSGIVNSAVVSAGTPDPVTSNNAGDSPPVNVAASADLSLTKSASASSVNVNDTITYTIKVKNSGPSTASNVTVSDNLPSTVTVISAVVPGGGSCTSVGNAVTCSIASIANGATATVTITAKAISAGSAANSATVSAVTRDPTTPNTGSSGPVTVNKLATKIAVDSVLGTRVSIVALSINLKPRATLTDTAGNPVVGRTVSFSANNALLIGTTALCSAPTDSHGVATCSANILATTLPGVLSFGYTGAFAGDTAYLPISGRGSLLNVVISP